MSDYINVIGNIAGTTFESAVEEGLFITGQVVTGGKGDDGIGIPAGGSTGQILAKASGTNFDAQWISAGSSITEALAIAYAVAL